jgi:hypothetical protein
VKFILDVPADAVDSALTCLAEAGFEAGSYYGEPAPTRGGPRRGWVRLAAERPLIQFTRDEKAAFDAQLERALRHATFDYERMATESSEAGDDLPPPPPDAAISPMWLA